MPEGLSFGAGWERTDEGAPEERACFGTFTIAHDGILLTEGYDHFVGRMREGPLVSLYHAAEWLAWNWWRLRWEPWADRDDWQLAHVMMSIGAGYVWPDVTVRSDGERVVFAARPSSRADRLPFRFVVDRHIVVDARQYVAAVDAFLVQILDRLEAEGVGETNLHRIWREVQAERSDPVQERRRRFEALAGIEPDEGEGKGLAGLLEAADEFGEGAASELAADHRPHGRLQAVRDLREQARALGHEAKPEHAVRLRKKAALPRVGSVPAWVRGTDAARALRRQEDLDGRALDNETLARLVGVNPEAMGVRRLGAAIAFVLEERGAARVVLRSGWETGRRFELARLLGDRIAAASPHDRLRPVTRAHTYRQKMQRAFAAELLCPLAALDEMLAGDYSAEALEEAAAHFNVSELAVRTLLVNNGRLDHEHLEADVERIAPD